MLSVRIQLSLQVQSAKGFRPIEAVHHYLGQPAGKAALKRYITNKADIKAPYFCVRNPTSRNLVSETPSTEP